MREGGREGREEVEKSWGAVCLQDMYNGGRTNTRGEGGREGGM